MNDATIPVPTWAFEDHELVDLRARLLEVAREVGADDEAPAIHAIDAELERRGRSPADLLADAVLP